MFERLVCANPAQINMRTKCDGWVVCGGDDIYTCVDQVSWHFVSASRWAHVSAAFLLAFINIFFYT